MFALGDISRFKGEKETCKILKPVWDVVTDYLVIFLALLSILFAGMEVTSGSFECLAAVDCPGISRSNMSILLSHTMNRSACKAFYLSQKTSVIRKTVVLTDLKSSLQYANFVKSECSKSAIPNFLAYFWLVLSTQAFVLVVLDNLWLKLPITASAIENFVELVIECYASPIPNFALTQALSDISTTRRRAFSYQPVGQPPVGQPPVSQPPVDQPPVDQQQDNEIENSVDFDNDESCEYDILGDPATVSAIKTLYEKVQTLKKDIKSPRKIVKIYGLYLLQSVLQAIFTFAFIIIDSYFMKDMKGTMTCTVTQYIPVPHDYFICSHGLAPAFVGGLYIYLIILGLSFFIFVGIIIWTVKIVYKCGCADKTNCKSRCKYVFRENELPATKLADISKEDDDFGFLLHLLHHYNLVYVNRLAHFLSQKNKRKIEAYYITKDYPVSELRKQLDENRKKITFSKLRAIPQTIFQLATEIVKLELIECRPLENEDFDDFGKLTNLRKLSIVKCGLKCIPDGIFKLEWLEKLSLKGNHITSINCDKSNLKNLTHINLSDNGLKTVTPDLEKLENVFAIYLSGNPEFTVQSLKAVLACPRLRILDPAPHMFQIVHELNSSEQEKFSRCVKMTKKETVIPYTPGDVPHIDIDNTDKIYKMDSSPKGVAIIFNNVSYGKIGYGDRHGSEKDVYKLKSLFEQIGFDTLCCTDYEAEQAKQFLEKCATDEKYKDCDCIVVCVLSHGEEGGIIFLDGEVVPVMDLVEYVQKSSLYEEKPKLFFIQACRGKLNAGSNSNVAVHSTARNCREDLGSTSKINLVTSDALEEMGAPSQSKKEASKAHVMTGVDIHVPKGADILLSYSTMQGYTSFRNTQHGSWYVQNLTKVFSQHAWEEDVLSLLTLVNYEIVRASTTSGWRQVPAPQSTLRKKLYFLPGYPNQRWQIEPRQASTT